MQPLGILDLLRLRGFDARKPTRFVRHQGGDYDIRGLIRANWLEMYQCYQSRPVFDRCEQVVSFVGEEGTKALLWGVFRMAGPRRDGRKEPFPTGCPYEEWTQDPYFYDLRHVPEYEDLEKRVVIEWGKGTIQWCQKPSNKEVVEMFPRGRAPEPFRDYLDFTLTHPELTDLIRSANREWRARLSAVAGVYLILDSKTGKQYVGSASGAEGIWGRWSEYADNGHGDNKLLNELVTGSPKDYPKAFTFSILQILPRTFAKTEVVKWERRYKEKLGSYATDLNGLNANR